MPAEPPDEETARLSPTPDEAQRHLDRLADRLRVMGPRLAGRTSAEAAATLAAIRHGLQQLADLAAAQEGRPAQAVPQLDPHALADQALVLGGDLLGPSGAQPGGPARGSDLFRSRAVEAIDSVYALL